MHPLIHVPSPCADGEQTCAGFPWWVQVLLGILGCLIAAGILNLLFRFVFPHVPKLDLSFLDEPRIAPVDEADARALLTTPVQWSPTRHGETPYLAVLAGRSWTLRVNDLPAGQSYTLLCDDVALELEDWPAAWVRPPPPAPAQPPAPGPGAGAG